MIRTALASPWFPLSYWSLTVVITALHCFKLHMDERQLRRVSMENRAPSRVQGQVLPNVGSPVVQTSRSPVANPFSGQSAHLWNPRIFCLSKSAAKGDKFTPAIRTGQPAATTNSRSSEAPLQVTMLSIRAEPMDGALPNALSVQCRTSLAVSNIHGTAVSIQGVVTQEVVSSSGKILIMAGSRVAGSAILDLENNRFKSDGQWTIYFNDTELKVHARLLDRPRGLSGIIGQARVPEIGNSEPDLIPPASHLVVVPANTPFTLDACGEIELRDVASTP